MNYSSEEFHSTHQRLTVATVSGVSDYFARGFANSPDDLTLLRMFPCASGALSNNYNVNSYNGEERMKQAVPISENSAMFMGEEGDGGGGRWPRQETLTLLEVRARLDSRFRQCTQKAPLWDEVSRIMAEEYGYNRSGKKCKEKLENLCKYYKKTKQGKVGRHDGRHYRFFRQLEALYGDQGGNDLPIATQTKGNADLRTSAFNAIQAPSIFEGLELSLIDSTDWDSSSTEEEVRDDQDLSLRGRRYREESSFRQLLEMQMGRLVEMQDIWLNKILKRIEQLDQERISQEEEWRRQEAARFELYQKTWNTEQARIKARDDIFIQTLERISKDRKGLKFSQTGGIAMP